MLKLRQAISAGDGSGSESSWALGDQPFSAPAATGTFPLLAVGPSNTGATTRVAVDAFGGTALAAATTTKGIGVLNKPVGVLDGMWVFLLAADAGTATYRLQVLSAGAPGNAVTGPSNLTALTAVSGLTAGWNKITLTVPTERQAVVQGTAQAGVCLIYPGDVVQVVVATASPATPNPIVLDIA